VLQHACVSSPNAVASTLCISGIPDALDTYRQFNTPVYAVFSLTERALPIPPGEIENIIAFILMHNETLRSYVRVRLTSVREIGIVSMDEPDEGINFALSNAEGPLLRDHEMEMLQTSYQCQKLCQFHMLSDELVDPVICWIESGGCDILESGSQKSASTLIPKVLVSVIKQPCNYFIHELKTL
jgi:hypothetical protein